MGAPHLMLNVKQVAETTMRQPATTARRLTSFCWAFAAIAAYKAAIFKKTVQTLEYLLIFIASEKTSAYSGSSSKTSLQKILNLINVRDRSLCTRRDRSQTALQTTLFALTL
jgi:hypothetical protein